MKYEFFISDLHLDHKNIIRYCCRPFASVGAMNHSIVSNWNETVGRKDVVYFLGDMCYGRGNRGINYWLRRLNGKIVFIRGYHDRSNRIRFHNSMVLNRNGAKFLLIHNPRDALIEWDGWVIHGHTHNNQPEYPLIGRKNKTINVSAEMVGYRPIPLEKILSLIDGSE